MANVKISGLPEATSVAETDELEVNQAGTSRRADKSLIYKASTRTLESVTTQSTVSVGIPAGCVHFVARSDDIVMSSSAAVFAAKLYNTADTVVSTVSGVNKTITTAFVGNSISAVDQIARMSAGSGTDRWVKLRVDRPRDSGNKTTFESEVVGELSNTDTIAARFGVADSAQDDDTIRFDVTTGTFTGDIYIDWYY